MSPSRDLFSTLAQVLRYPSGQWPELLARALAAAQGACAENLRGLQQKLANAAPASLEERYVAAFDFDPEATLEIGWHLYGEDYRRGAFLVRMRQLLRDRGVAENGELPDHLSLLLQLVPALPPAEAENLAREALLPALEKIHATLERKGSPFALLVAAVRHAVGELAHQAEGGSYGRG